MRRSVATTRPNAFVAEEGTAVNPQITDLTADTSSKAKVLETKVPDAGEMSIAEADKQSSIFHQLLDELARTNGIVYIEAGKCGHGVRACVPHSIALAGPFRLLRILIHPYDAGHASAAQLAGIIAHEVQHALELLSDLSVTNAAAMFSFYGRAPSADGAFETAAAIVASDRVSREMTDAVRRRQ